MKKLIAAIVFVAGALTVTHAQDIKQVRGKVPFAFYVGNTQVSAGEYDFTRAASHVILVRDTDWKDGVMMPTFAGTKPEIQEKPILVFRKYGEDRYFLGEIWHAGSRDGVILPKSKREKEAVSSLLITSAKPETVIILARAR